MKFKTILLLFGFVFTICLATLGSPGDDREPTKQERVINQEPANAVQALAELTEVNAVEGGSTKVEQPVTVNASTKIVGKADTHSIHKALIN